MNVLSDRLTLSLLTAQEPTPYELLLLADPDQHMIDSYLVASRLYVAKLASQVVGVLVLTPSADNTVEIKNMAVAVQHQGQGVGTWLLEKAAELAKRKGYAAISIGTANSSIQQLYLYQKAGFDLTEIRRNFFVANYPQPIFEAGIRAKHLLVLTKPLA